jgi:acetyl esterase/lipase/lysophospholipase L1-like esterase
MFKLIFVPVLCLFLSFMLQMSTSIAQQTIPLYKGKAPGSESWNWSEKENFSKLFNTQVVFNVVDPSLLVFKAPASIANGTAIIIAPGGGFQALSINSEGIDLAKWLNARGVTAFVLKYRLAKSNTDDPAKEMMEKVGNPSKMEAENGPIMKLAMKDGQTAVQYVRSHAREYGIDPKKIGFIGFSAGGTVAMSVVYNSDENSLPDFVAPIYAYAPMSIGTAVPTKNMPAFIAVASDDQMQLVPHSLDIYSRWQALKQPAELHVYEKGGHGFGMKKLQMPTDKWVDDFGDWLLQRGLIKNNPTEKSAIVSTQTTKEQEDHQKWEFAFHNDWANINRFAAENKKLGPPSSREKRVVFMGNSITEGWINMLPQFFEGRPYINRGIGGQTTSQMLVRFKQDVVDLKPAVVVILGGTNDIAGNTGPTTVEMIFEHLVSMAELARANRIQVILSSVLPVYDYPWNPGLKPAEKIIALNDKLRNWCTTNNAIYLDYFSAMVDERNGLKASLTNDGVHPTVAGYKVMEPLLEKAISEALRKTQ